VCWRESPAIWTLRSLLCFLLERDDSQLVCQACEGPVDINGLCIPAGQGIVGRAVSDNACQIVRDVRLDPDFAATVDNDTGFTMRSILCAPMSVKDSCVGAIGLINKTSGDGLFSERDRHVLLPVRGDVSFPVCGVNVSARSVLGDFYDFFPLADGRIGFNVGDVSGKGINAALLMAKTSSLYGCLGKEIDHPGELLSRVNAELCDTGTRGMFVTLVGGAYDPRRDSVRIANAGHQPPILCLRDGAYRAFPPQAPPLGIALNLVGDEGYPVTEFALEGGCLAVFTDGMTE
jgi:sigma-B regulation protein RsbU (phosphoserine phosphatase)